MLLEELLRCQIQEWYPEFRRHTIPTAIIPLPAAFIRYLAGQPACPDPDADEDSEPLPFLLPSLTSGRHPFPPLHAHLPDPVSLLDRDNSDLFFDSADDDCEADNPLRPAFPELEAAIDAAIAELGGAALPKLNWSAPKDATFMSADATIRCTCFAEVAMLLRSSDCVAHDLVSARPSCEDFVRAKGVPWNTTKGSGAEEGARPNAHKSGSQPNGEGSGEGKSDRQNAQGSGDTGARPNGGGSSNGAGSLSVSRETCDEGGRQSAADDAPEEDVGQKSNEMTWVDDGFQYYLALRKWYPGLRPESEFRCFVRGRRLVAVSQRDPSAYYPSLPGWSVEVQPKIEDFFEEVIEPQFASENYTFDVYVRADGKVKLIDFNPWGGYTLPLLFTWEELEEEGRGEEVNFRVVMQQGAVRPGLMTAIPYDMLDWGEGSGWDVFLKKADKELNRQMTSLGPPDSVHDWTKEPDIGLSNQNDTNQAYSRKNWRLLRCQNDKFTVPLHTLLTICIRGYFEFKLRNCSNGVILKSILFLSLAGLCIFEELVEVEYLARSCSRAMRAVGVVETTCEAIFGLIMSMDVTRYEWDCSFQYGSLVEEVDGHTAILYHRLQLNWCSMLVWPRDICYVRYWRRNDDGSYVVLFRSTEHQNCGPQPGFVRAFIESGGFKISPLKCFNGRPRTQVQHLMQIDLKGWGMNYFPSFQYNSLLQMLNCVAGLREFFSQNDDIHTVPRIPVMHTMANVASVKKDQKLQDADSKTKQANSVQADNKSSDMMDEESEEDDDYQVPEANLEEDTTKSDSDTKCSDPIDLSCFSGIIRQDANEKSRNCWAVPDSKIFKVRSKTFPHDKSKVPAGKYLMELVAIDWFKDTERMDHVARRQGCAAQVAAEKGMFTFVVNIQIPGSSHYSVVLYFVAKSLKKGSLLQRFADGDDDFRNSRLKLIPSVSKGSWIVRQSVGSTPCLLGKAVDCSYMRGPGYLEVDVDIGSSAVANGVLGLVFGVVTTLVVDMAFLVQPSFLLMERLFRGLRRGRGGWSLYHREQQIGLGTTTGLAMHGGGRTNGEARCSIRDQITSRGGFSSQTKGYYHLSEWNSLPVACSLYTNTMQCKVFLFLVLLFSCW